MIVQLSHLTRLSLSKPTWDTRKNDQSSAQVANSVLRSIWSIGGAVAQSVERATPGEEVPGSIPAVAARSLLVGSVSV